jgi:hypothetical protein
VSTKGRPPAKRPALKLQDNKGRIQVKNLSSHEVSSTVEGLKLAAFAKSRRQVSGTSLNGASSRSHSVCQLEIVMPGGEGRASPTFWITDLAGSERSKRTGVAGGGQQQ